MSGSPSVDSCDVVFVGGGHNAMVAATLVDDLRARGLVYVNTDRPTGVSMRDGSAAVPDRDPSAASLFGSADSALDRLTSPVLRAMLGCWTTHTGVDSFDAGSALWPKVFVMTILPDGLPIPRGGSGQLTQALTSLISDFGGDVVTSAGHRDAPGREPAGPRSADNRVGVSS